MKNILRTSIFLLCLGYVLPSTLAQITFKLELLPDQANYQVSIIPDTTWTFPYNLTSSAQATIRVPHATGDHRFEVENLTSLVPNTDWDDNARVDSPEEAPTYDYISFGLLTLGTGAYQYQTGVEIPLFTFANGGVACVDSIELINNDTDPFMPPNSYGANIGNSIAVLGAGLLNAYTTNNGTGRALCTPEPDCEAQIITNEEVFICEGDSYQDQPITNDTIINRHYISFAGCDSLSSIQITFVEPDTVEVHQVDCHAGISMSVTDTMTMTYTNSAGCDSVVITYNETMPIFDTTYQVSIPQGLWYEGIAVENDTTITFFYTSSSGCDSTITVNIMVLENPTTFINETLCDGGIFEGQVYHQSVSFIDTIPQPNGVDSFVITNILVLPTYQDTLIVNLCDGEMYDNISYSENTTLREMYTSVQGCDSTVVTEIIVANSYESLEEIEICIGELYNNVAYQQDTTFTTTYNTANGCDSVIHVQLVVHPLPEVQINGKTEICLGDMTEFSVANAASYSWTDGSTSQSIQTGTAGNYAVTVTNEQGCANEAAINLLVHQLDVTAEAIFIGCDESDTGMITFHQENNEPLLYSVNGGLSFSSNPSFENLAHGTYALIAEDASGCQWEDQKILSASEELLIDLGDDLEIQLGDSVAIQTLTNRPISLVEWKSSAYLSCLDCEEPMAHPTESTLFQVTVTDENGCIASDNLQIFVNQEPILYFPNAFSPDGDGVNDLYVMYAGTSVKEIASFKIFSRWGSLMFEKEHFLPNDPKDGWDGKYKNKDMQSGVFIYMAEVELVDGSMMVMKGEITLIK